MLETKTISSLKKTGILRLFLIIISGRFINNVHCSAIEKAQKAADEGSDLDPASAYSASKIWAEKAVRYGIHCRESRLIVIHLGMGIHQS